MPDHRRGDPAPEKASRQRRNGRARPRAPVAIAVAVAALLVVVGSVVAFTGEDPGTVEGEPLPDMELAALRGDDVALSDLPDGPVVLNFYASWCPPCVAEMRDALGPVDKALDGDVTIIGIAMQDDPDGAVAIAQESGVEYPLVEDPDGQAFQRLEMAAMPATAYVMDGQLVARHNGTFTRPQFERQLDEHLGVEVPDA